MRPIPDRAIIVHRCEPTVETGMYSYISQQFTTSTQAYIRDSILKMSTTREGVHYAHMWYEIDCDSEIQIEGTLKGENSAASPKRSTERNYRGTRTSSLSVLFFRHKANDPLSRFHSAFQHSGSWQVPHQLFERKLLIPVVRLVRATPNPYTERSFK